MKNSILPPIFLAFVCLFTEAHAAGRLSINPATRVIPMYGTCTFQEAQVGKSGSWSYWYVVSKDNSGVEHKVAWKKFAENKALPIYLHKINREHLRNGIVYPFSENGPITTGENLVKTKRIFEVDMDLTSAAVYACEKNGTHLPTKEEYEALGNCFQPHIQHSVKLSDAGLSELYRKFPDMKPSESVAFPYFWSSSVEVVNHPNGYKTYKRLMFNSTIGFMARDNVDTQYTDGTTAEEVDKYSVRCVDRIK